MKIKKINYKIICDFAGCGKLAEFCVSSNNTINNNGINICKGCAKELHKELSKSLKGNENENTYKK
jgi:hypothetical protein